jgi:hypothetical protein
LVPHLVKYIAAAKEEKMKRNRLFSRASILVIAALVLLFAVLGCDILPTPSAEPEIEFEAREDSIERGECTILEWDVQGAEEYPVFLDGEEVDASDWQEVCPQETTIYELVVGAPGGPHKERVIIQVESGPGPEPTTPPAPAATTPPAPGVTPTSRPPAPPTTAPPTTAPPTTAPPPQPPSITYFRANGTAGSITVNAGTTVTLSWEWQRVSEGYLDPGNTPMACPALPCTYQVTPAATTTYTLRAVNAAGTDTETVTVNVTSEPPLTFTFSPTSGNPGSDVELYLSRAVEGVTVYYNDRVLPKRVLDGGSRLRVTIPGDASSGYFELQWDGQSVRASQQFVVTAPTPTLILHNNTGVVVCYVYFSLTSEASWGSDRLGSGETVAPGATRSWTVDAGQYDMKAEDCQHNELHREMAVNIVGTYHWYAQ